MTDEEIRQFVRQGREAYGRCMDEEDLAILGETQFRKALDIIEALSARLAALSPAPNSGSHWDGCWRARGHHECAVREAESRETKFLGISLEAKP